MKKVLLLILFIFLFSGCTTHRLTLEKKKVTSFTFDQDSIQKEDYNDVLDILNKIDFHEVKEADSSRHQIVIHTKDEIFQFQISEEFTMLYKKDQKIYASKETNEVKKLVKKIESITTKYKDTSFLSIKVQNIPDHIDTDLVIRIDKKEQYLKISSTEPLRNFKIHRLEFQDDKYSDIDLLYEKKFISPDETIYIRVDLPEKIGTIRFSFETSKGYQYSAIPIYNEKEQRLDLNETIESKAN